MSIHLNISGFAEKSGAERLLKIVRDSDAEGAQALGNLTIAPSLGITGTTYDLIAALGIVSIPGGIIGSYIASILFKYFHEKPARKAKASEQRVQIVITRETERLFVFIDREMPEEAIEREVSELLKRVSGDDRP